MEMLIMRGTTIFIITHNASATPRIGDTILLDGIKVKVKDVVWHLDNRNWVEIQI